MRADDFSRTSAIHRSPIVAILTRFSPAFIISIATVSVFAPKMIVRSGFHSLATVFSYLALAPCPSQAFVISPVTSGYTSHTATVGALPRSIDLFWFAKDLRGVPSVLLAGNDDISIDEAFTDQIDFFGDPMIRTMFGVFGVAIILLMGASLVMNKMDSAIENVLSTYRADALSIDETDGVSVAFEDWRFNLRQSNTEPLVRLNVEGTGNADAIASHVSAIVELLGGTRT